MDYWWTRRYGETGPLNKRASTDLNYEDDAGLLSNALSPQGDPVLPNVLVADIGAGAYPAVMNILLALRAREASGEGCYLDISMYDNIFTFMHGPFGVHFGGKRWPEPSGERLTGGWPRYQLYRTKDGRYVAAGCLEQHFWEAFCECIGLPAELRDDFKDQKQTIEAVREIIARETSETWKKRFEGKDVCCSIVATFEEALAEPHLEARDLLRYRTQTPNGEIPALPVPVVPAFRDAATRTYPPLGEANDALLGKPAKAR